MKFSVVIPAHNEVESVGLTVESCVEKLEAAAIDYEIVVVDDASGDGTSEVVLAISERNPRVRCLRSTLPPGFGHAVRAGLEAFTGDAVAIMMADLSDSPGDLLSYYKTRSSRAMTVHSGRDSRGRAHRGVPAGQARPQPCRQRGHQAALPARLRGHHQRLQGLSPRGRRAAPAAALKSLQPNRRDAPQGIRTRL